MGWTLFWRGVGSFVLLLLVVNLALVWWLPELSRTSPSLWIALLPLVIVTLLCTFFVMPFVVRTLVNRHFRGFHVQFIRDAPERSSAAIHTGWQQ